MFKKDTPDSCLIVVFTENRKFIMPVKWNWELYCTKFYSDKKIVIGYLTVEGTLTFNESFEKQIIHYEH